MQKIDDRFYLGKCNDLNNALAANFKVILTCQYACSYIKTRIDHQQSIECCESIAEIRQNEIKAADEICLMPFRNREVPDYSIAQVKEFFKIMLKWQDNQDVIIISEHGESRGPTLGLLWMAFGSRQISNSSFSAARLDFNRIYPRYKPWPGFVIFFNQEWEEVRKIFHSVE